MMLKLIYDTNNNETNHSNDGMINNVYPDPVNRARLILVYLTTFNTHWYPNREDLISRPLLEMRYRVSLRAEELVYMKSVKTKCACRWKDTSPQVSITSQVYILSHPLQ